MQKILKNKAFRICVLILLCAFACVLAVKFIKITPADKSENKAKNFDENKPYITLTIECTAVYETKNYSNLNSGLKEKGVLPADGFFVKSEQVNFSEDESAFDVLIDFCKANDISVDYDSPEANAFHAAYVKGIGGLYEFDCTKNSGWVYEVNGEQPDRSMSDYEVRSGDEITVKYAVF